MSRDKNTIIIKTVVHGLKLINYLHPWHVFATLPESWSRLVGVGEEITSRFLEISQQGKQALFTTVVDARALSKP